MTDQALSELTPKQDARRRRVIQAALQLAAEGGYDAVQMREISATANVALGTIYRYFSSKDHLLAAAMAEWTGELQHRVAQQPPKGDTAAERLIDVLKRACRAMERQPKLTGALVTALGSADAGVRAGVLVVAGRITQMADEILSDLPPEVRAGVRSVIGHVWYSTLNAWANGRAEITYVIEELERAIHLMVDPYEKSGNGRRR